MFHEDGSPAIKELFYIDGGCYVMLHPNGEYHVHESDHATVEDLQTALAFVPPRAVRLDAFTDSFGAGTEHVYRLDA